MNRMFAVALGVVVFGLAGAAGADYKTDDNATKIVGKWEVTKSGSDIPPGSTIEFTKDGKLSVLIKKDEIKIEGTYKVEKAKLTVKLKVADQTLEESVTIQKLAGDLLELKDKDGKVDELKRMTKAFTAPQ